MEEQLFNEILKAFEDEYGDVKRGKMMSSEAITYRGKVFAFFSRKKKMVFKLGKDFDPANLEMEIQVFNPFTNRAPLNGWFEVPFEEHKHWKDLTHRAFNILKEEG